MNINSLPEKDISKCDNSMYLAYTLTHSVLTAKVFLLALDNGYINTKEIAIFFNKSNAQIYQVCQRLESFGVFNPKTAKNFILNRAKYDEETWLALKEDAHIFVHLGKDNKN
jgi:hypothetical protein